MIIFLGLYYIERFNAAARNDIFTVDKSVLGVETISLDDRYSKAGNGLFADGFQWSRRRNGTPRPWRMTANQAREQAKTNAWFCSTTPELYDRPLSCLSEQIVDLIQRDQGL